MTATHNLIQILLPANGGDEGVFERLAQELTAKFGGVTSFFRAPAEGRWNSGTHTEHDDIAVIEVMVEDVDYGYWAGLRTRLEQALPRRQFRMERAKQTERILRAVRNPFVTILGPNGMPSFRAVVTGDQVW